MVGVEELRRVDVGTDILDHDIRRVAVAAHRDVAKGESESLHGGAVSAAYDVDAGANGEGEAGIVDRLGALEVCGDGRGDAALTRDRMIAHFIAHVGAGAFVY